MKTTIGFEVSDFFTTEQVKQKLELFVKEKGLTHISVGHIAHLKWDEVEGHDHILISCSSECKQEPPSLFLAMRKERPLNTYGCSEYQLDIIKMMMERIYCRDIEFYRDCDSISYTAWSDEFGFGFYARDYAVCDLKLSISFELSREDGQYRLTLGVNSTGCRDLLDRFTDNHIPCLMSTAGHNDGMLFMQRLSSIDIVEISYAYAVMGDDGTALSFPLYMGTSQSLYQLLRSYRACGGFRPNKKPVILYQIHRDYEMFTKSHPTSDAGFTVETFLLRALERSSVEVYSVNYSPDRLSILFAVGDRGFVWLVGCGIFIQVIGTSNILTIQDSYIEEDPHAVKSRICDFLGLEMSDHD